MTYQLVQFTNQPQTTVSNGGTAAPAGGTSEQWTVASSSLFPPAAISGTPPTVFHVADTATTSEIIAVTAVTSTVWGVTRGAESTSPVTHASGFTVQQVVTAGGLTSFHQNQSTGTTAATTIAASTALGTLGTFVPPAADVPAAGVCYDFAAFGRIWTALPATLLTISTTWNAATVASAITGTGGTIPQSMTSSSFWIEGRVDCFGATTMVSGFNVGVNKLGTLGSLIGSSSAAVTISGTGGPLSLVATTGAGASITTTGFICRRIS